MKRLNRTIAVQTMILFAAAAAVAMVPSKAQARKPGVSVDDVKGVIEIGEKLHKLITNVPRKGRIHIRNFSQYTLDNPRNYLFSGNIIGLDAATEIPAGRANAIAVRKSDGAATGCVGVITYRIKGTRSRLAILYSIPYDYNLYQNWFKYAVISDRTPINKALYHDMYYNYGKLTNGRVAKASSGQAAWRSGEFSMKGTMDTSGDFKMFVEFRSTKRRPVPKPVKRVTGVSRVNHVKGSFQLLGNRMWKETLNGRVGYFRETSRTATSVFLVKNNGVRIELNMSTRKVYLLSRNTKRELYRVTSSR